jgi:hypothetical protein
MTEYRWGPGRTSLRKEGKRKQWLKNVRTYDLNEHVGAVVEQRATVGVVGSCWGQFGRRGSAPRHVSNTTGISRRHLLKPSVAVSSFSRRISPLLAALPD